MSKPNSSRLLDTSFGRLDQLLGLGQSALSATQRTVRFLYQRHRFRSRDTDVFIASYPRSGTTWAQAIGYLLVTGHDRFEFDHISDVVPWWERTLSHRSDALDRLAKLPSPRLFKTHLVPQWLPPRARCIYLHRNSQDVTESYYHLYRHYLGFADSFEVFRSRMHAGKVQYGSQSAHIAHWRQSKGDVLWVAYEQLVANPMEQIVRIADFMDREVPAHRLAAICRLTQFEHMKQHNQRFDHLGEIAYQMGIQAGSFVRTGPKQADADIEQDTRELSVNSAPATQPRPVSIWQLQDYLR